MVRNASSPNWHRVPATRRGRNVKLGIDILNPQNDVKFRNQAPNRLSTLIHTPSDVPREIFKAPRPRLAIGLPGLPSGKTHPLRVMFMRFAVGCRTFKETTNSMCVVYKKDDRFATNVVGKKAATRAQWRTSQSLLFSQNLGAYCQDAPHNRGGEGAHRRIEHPQCLSKMTSQSHPPPTRRRYK